MTQLDKLIQLSKYAIYENSGFLLYPPNYQSLYEQVSTLVTWVRVCIIRNQLLTKPIIDKVLLIIKYLWLCFKYIAYLNQIAIFESVIVVFY